MPGICYKNAPRYKEDALTLDAFNHFASILCQTKLKYPFRQFALVGKVIKYRVPDGWIISIARPCNSVEDGYWTTVESSPISSSDRTGRTLQKTRMLPFNSCKHKQASHIGQWVCTYFDQTPIFEWWGLYLSSSGWLGADLSTDTRKTLCF